ncbi:MAG: putative addiction module antidote protein [Candidatus Omnitrophica bacterium]|nr:putative addiction module antidote protein [Candidatus Omnitrophota bacterium]
MKKKKIPTYHDDLIKRLKDPARAEGYLNATLEDEDKRVFLLALRNVIEAYGGMTKIARLSKISREHIYRMLSAKGNPELATLKNLLSAIGLKLAIESKNQRKKAA